MSLFKSKSRDLRAWETEHKAQGSLCHQCLSLFSCIESLNALASDKGLPISVKHLFREELPDCPLCLRLAEVVCERLGYKNFLVYAPFDDGRHKSRDFRLVAECEVPPDRDGSGYPRDMLHVLYLSLVHASGRAMVSDPHFLTLYKSPGVPPWRTIATYSQGFDMTCDEFMAKAKSVLGVCMNEHPHCKAALSRSQRPSLPTRVIDVGLGDKSEHVRLHTTDGSEHGPYVALSYTWGKDEPKDEPKDQPKDQPNTTKENIESFAKEIPLHAMAKSIQDAVRVTQGLGIRYLWVDAVCIIQNDPADKKHELGLMGGIYRDAIVTILATTSLGAAAGFAECDPPTGCQLPFLLPDRQLGSITALPSKIELPQNVKQKLDTRGWTFQERLLSKRLLIFDNGELKWQCQTSLEGVDPEVDYITDDDDGWMSAERPQSGSSFSLASTDVVRTTGLTPLAFVNNANDTPNLVEFVQRTGSSTSGTDAERAEFWREVVDEFTSRFFTVVEDRLPGIAGIIDTLQESWKDDCLAGLWRSRLARDLYWRRATIYDIEGTNLRWDIEQRLMKSKSARARLKLVGAQLRSALSRNGNREWKWWVEANLAAEKVECQQKEEKMNNDKPYGVYIAPSWSWLSYSGRVSLEGDLVPTASVVDVSIQPVVPNKPLLGLAEGCNLTLETLVLDAPAESGVVVEHFDLPDDKLPPRDQRIYAQLGVQESVHWLGDGTRPLPAGLILAPNGTGYWKRVGVFRPDFHKSMSWPDPSHDAAAIIAGLAPRVQSTTFDQTAIAAAEQLRSKEWEGAERRTIVIY